MGTTADDGSVKVPGDRYQRRVRWVGLGLLAFLYVVVPIPIRLAGGAAGFDVVFLLMFGGIGVLCWGGLCLLWWRIVTVQVRWIAPQKVTWIVLALLPVILVGARSVYRSWPSVRAARILRNVELAPLPPSAHALNVNLWSMLVSGEGYLRFHATREDIEGFLTASPVFRDVEYVEHADEPGPYSYARDDRVPKSPEEFHRYISRDNGAPSWVIKELRPSMIRCRIDPLGSQISGAVIIDEESNLVFVKLSFD